MRDEGERGMGWDRASLKLCWRERSGKMTKRELQGLIPVSDSLLTVGGWRLGG